MEALICGCPALYTYSTSFHAPTRTSSSIPSSSSTSFSFLQRLFAPRSLQPQVEPISCACGPLPIRGPACRYRGFFASEARLGSSGGAGVLERPGLDQSQSPQEARVEEGGEMGKLVQRRIFGGGDRYRVLLLDHEKHTESQVASVLPKVVPSVTVEEARNCFRQSREKGIGVVTVTVKEHAEFYAQMMARCGLRSRIEPDSNTI